MEQNKETMADLLLSLESETRPLMTVFEDLVNLLVDGITFGADMEKRAKPLLDRYKGDDARKFRAAALQFQTEYENRNEADECVDILGEFYETHLYGKGATQRFIPWEVCQEVVRGAVRGRNGKHVEHATADPCCGSGRLLLADIATSGTERLLLGIDPDPLCVKMTALNLFLKGAFIGEIMCADATKGADHFAFSYRLSLIPHGLLCVTEREDSKLWHVNREVFAKQALASNLDVSRIRMSLIRISE